MTKSATSGVLAKRYATALFELAASDLAGVEKSARVLLETCKNKEFRNFLANPTLSRTEHSAVLKSFVPAGVLQNLVIRMSENRRLAALADVLNAFISMCEAARGEVKVLVETANVLDEKHLNMLASGLGSSLNKKVNIETVNAPKMLGGLRLRLGNTMIDYSVANRLDRLATSLKSKSIKTYHIN